MPFKMTSPLTKMATTAMKTVQKSAMKLKDLNNDGKTTKADLLIKKGVYNKDGSPATLRSPAKKFEPFRTVGGDISNMASSISDMLKQAKDAFYKQREESLKKARTKEEKDKVLKNLPNSKLAETLEKIRKENEVEESTTTTTDKKSTTKGAGGKGGGSSTTTTTNTTGTSKKPTYSQAWDKMTDAAKDKYKSKADFIKAAKAYNNRGKTTETTGPTEAETETKTETKTGTAGKSTITNANDISGSTGTDNTAAGILKRAKEREKAAAEKKKKEAAAAAAAAAEAKKNKKLTPKERRKAERNIKAQEKANKIIRKKGSGTEIKVNKKNTTATASDRRKLKQGAKRLEQKLSLAQEKIDGKNKKKNGKDKKGKDKNKKDKGVPESNMMR